MRESAPSSCCAAIFGLVESLRIDQVADRFGLREVDAAVEKGAHSELAGLGEARPSGDAEFDDVAQHDWRAVGGDLNDVVGCVGVGLGEVGDDDFIDALLVRSDIPFGKLRAGFVRPTRNCKGFCAALGSSPAGGIVLLPALGGQECPPHTVRSSSPKTARPGSIFMF